MSKEIIIENGNKPQRNKKQLIFAILGMLVSIAVIVVAILYLTKVMQRNIAIHILYPGLALNCLLNGFSMKFGGNNKVAKIDYIASGVISAIYVLIVILSIL